MKIFRELSNNITPGTVATIGIFDGVHRAHQQIIERLLVLAKEKKTESLLITMWPHPRYVLNKDADQLKLLSTLEEKLTLLDKSGIDNVLIIPFDKQFSSLPFDKFIHRIIVDKLRIQHFVVGYNHQFGRDRQGNFQNLKEQGEKYNITIEQLPKIEVNNQSVSSSTIRKCIINSEIEMANEMLGHDFVLCGKVIHGSKIGRKIGFPTANIEVLELYKILPPEGVYAIKTVIDDKEYEGMLNIGYRPTINTSEHKIIEANIFNFEGDLYNTNLNVRFIKQIRNEQKFNSVELLIEQILKDRIHIQEYFRKKKQNN